MLRIACLITQIYCAATASFGGLPLLWCTSAERLLLACACEHSENNQPTCCSQHHDGARTDTGTDGCCVLTVVDLELTEQPRPDHQPSPQLLVATLSHTEMLATPPTVPTLQRPPVPSRPPNYILFSGFLV